MKPTKQKVKGCGGITYYFAIRVTRRPVLVPLLYIIVVKIADSRLLFEIGYPLVCLTAERNEQLKVDECLFPVD